MSPHSFAGVTDREAAARVISATGEAVLRLEVQLAALHLILGGAAGGLIGRAWRGVRPERTPIREAIHTGLTSLFLFTMALLGMVASYPQLFADRWWLGGGWLAYLQRLVTHTLGPWPFDVALVSALATLLIMAARSIPSRPRARLGALAVVLAMLGVAGSGPTAVRPAPRTDAMNLLILASDSLRSDRIEDATVMPEIAARLPQGSLYRHAVVPIARTYPSWVSTLTGREPRAHGVRHMFPTGAARVDIGPTLFTDLRDRGYFTFATSDFAGDIFPGFEGGFESLNTPRLNVDTLAASTVLGGHTWSLPFLRIGFLRGLFPFWKNLPSLADPRWLVDDLEKDIGNARGRPFAGLVFFSTAHFPYPAPYPHYRRGAGDYRGPYLYHVPPVLPVSRPSPQDVLQIGARYDGALSAIDDAIGKILRSLEKTGLSGRTLVVVTGDHGEDLYEVDGIAGHGDTIQHLQSQSVPLFFLGPGVARDRRFDTQVRLYDLPATALDLLDPGRGRLAFGDGLSLLDKEALRPVCVETGLWFWPGRPLGLIGQRLDYPGISALLEIDDATREMVLRDDMEPLVETAKERGIVVGNRLWREQLTPQGLATSLVELPGLDPVRGNIDVKALFEERCILGDPLLARLYGTVVFDRREARPAVTAP
jgi:Sulfatase